MTHRWWLIAVCFALGLLASVLLAMFDSGEDYQLGSGDRVPSYPVGMAPIDNVPTIPPGLATTTTQRRVRAASALPVSSRGATYPTDELLYALAMCETGGTMDQRVVSRSGKYLSYFQWALSTWHAAGGSGDPRDVSYEVQREIARSWVLRAGWAQWPVCSRKIGAR